MDTPTLHEDTKSSGIDMMMRRIRTVRRLTTTPSPGGAVAQVDVASSRPAASTDAPVIVALAASTGGPDALLRLLCGLPPGFDTPTVVVQHLGASYLPGFVSWLGDQTGLDVQAVEGRVRVQRGTVFVAAGDHHLVATAPGILEPTPDRQEIPFCPSADMLFASLARCWGTPGVAAVLTGMGRDGAEGLLSLREAGWTTLAQDEETSVVYGMPRAAAERRGAERILAIDAMGPAIHLALERAVPMSDPPTTEAS
jgi:two-component system response regulator WspF